MVAAKKAPAKAAAKPKAEEVSTDVVLEARNFEDLPDDLKAILEEADALQAEVEIEQNEITRSIKVEMLVRWRLMSKSGYGLQAVIAKAGEFQDKLEGLDMESIEGIAAASNASYEIIELLLGEKKAAEALEKVGDKLVLFMIWNEIQELAEVKR